MATRLKTVSFAFPPLASLADAVLTNLTQITLYLPENGKVFRSALLTISCDDIITASGGSIGTRRLDLRLGAAAYTTFTNTNALPNSGENISYFQVTDFVQHFTTNWAGTSMTCDVALSLDQTTGTTLGFVNVCATIDITYEYDDASATHIKTVRLPLNAPTGALATAKPVTATATIQALDTYLPEASKVYRDIYIVVQGNEHRNTLSTDHTITMQIDTLVATTTGNYEGALGSDRWYRFVDKPPAFTTNATHSWYLWASVARCNHPQAYMVVTYEFDPATTTTVMNSLLLPMSIEGPMGGVNATDYQRASLDLYVEEPSTIAVMDSALFVNWSQLVAMSFHARVGSGTFVIYTSSASVVCGSVGFMLRCETNLALARGKNTLTADFYRLFTTGYHNNIVSALWMINYVSAKAPAGVGSHNKTVIYPVYTVPEPAPGLSAELTAAAVAVQIPETSYYINHPGVVVLAMQMNTTSYCSEFVGAERLVAEGGHKWERISENAGLSDPEVGFHMAYSSDGRTFLKRYTGDPDTSRMDIEVARRHRVSTYNAQTPLYALLYYLTYHSIQFSVAGSITGSSGGTVTINLVSASTGNRLLQTSRLGNGAYNFTWYDSTEQVFTEAMEDATHLGRSNNGVAA